MRLTPEHFGAVGDAVTDDTAAVERWAHAVGDMLRPGSTYRTNRAVCCGSPARDHVDIPLRYIVWCRVKHVVYGWLAGTGWPLTALLTRLRWP